MRTISLRSAQLTKDFGLSPKDVIKTSVETITRHILFALSIDVYEIHPELNETQRDLRRSLKMSRTERKSAETDKNKKRNRRSLTKAMAVAATLEAGLVQARLEIKLGGDKSNNNKLSTNELAKKAQEEKDEREKAEAAVKPKIGMMRKIACWGGSKLMEYTLEAGPKIARGEMFPEVSERSERAFWKTSILAMKCAKWLQT